MILTFLLNIYLASTYENSNSTGITKELWKATIKQKKIDEICKNIKSKIENIKQKYFDKIDNLKLLSNKKELNEQEYRNLSKNDKENYIPRFSVDEKLIFRSIFYEYYNAVLNEGYKECFYESFDQFYFNSDKVFLEARKKVMRMAQTVNHLPEYQEFKYDIEENFWNLKWFLVRFADLRTEFIKKALLKKKELKAY